MMKTLFIMISVLIGFQVVGEKSLQAASIESIQLLKISSLDERAVIKTPDGKMEIIKTGDLIGENGRVIEITTGRVVIEEMTDKGIETVIIRLEDGKQKIERIKKHGGEKKLFHTPKSIGEKDKKLEER